MPIHPDTAIGAVRLTVSNLARSRDFYERMLGLTGTEHADGTLALGVDGDGQLLELKADSSAPALDRRATGLYHFAILVPSRQDLALSLRRVAEQRWPLDGASDHLVSEALYLSDPDGNGIEIYRDRARDEWPRAGGQLQMATIPLDLENLVGELNQGNGPNDRLPSGTRIGHVHLQVADLGDAERFYSGALGFDVTVRGYPGALFVSAGGYHHHIGLNTWHSAGASPPPPGALGLRSFDVLVPNQEELDRILERVSTAGIAVETSNGAALVHDPSGNGVRLTAGPGAP